MRKARLLKSTNNDIVGILAVNKDGKPKYSRSAGVPLTIDILNAMRSANLPEPIVENLKALVEIRDAAVHLCCERDEAFSYLLFTLAAASLKNSNLGATGEHHFVCEIRTEVRAAQKFAERADYTTAVDPSAAPGSVGHVRVVNLIDKYPLTYNELMARVRHRLPDIRPAQVDAILKNKVKGNAKLAAYNFRSKAQQRRYEEEKTLPKGIAVIYNEDAVRAVLADLGG